MKKKKLSFSEIILVVLTVVSSLLLAAVLFTTALSFLCVRFPGFLGLRTVKVTSPSMSPAISESSYILIRKTDISDLEVGDIITYSNNEVFVTHRITQKDDSGLFTVKGDANIAEDPAPVPYESILGKYVRTMRLLTALKTSDSPAPLVMLILCSVIPCACIVSVCVIRLRKKRGTNPVVNSEVV